MARQEMTIREAERILSLTEPYDLGDLSKRYRERAKKAHPDLGGTEGEMLQVNEAYDCLKTLFDDANAMAKRNPLKATGSHSASRAGAKAYDGVKTSQWASVADAAGIPFDDFMDILSAYEQMQREEEKHTKESHSGEQATQAAEAEAKSGTSAKTERTAPTAAKEPVHENGSTLKRFRHKLARIFAKLCRLPYGLVALAFFEWQALTAERAMNSIFDGMGMLFSILFEVLIVAPLLSWLIRCVIRSVLGAIARALAR